MIEDHSAAGKEVLIQATENIVTAAQELLQEGGISMEINQYAIATKIVSKFDRNLFKKYGISYLGVVVYNKNMKT